MDLSRSDAKKHENLFFVLALIFGLLLIFLEPPFVVPDEYTHYLNICRVSRGGIFADVENGVVGNRVAVGEIELHLQFSGKYAGNDQTIDAHTLVENLKGDSDQNVAFYAMSDAQLNPTPYLIPAFVIAVFRFFVGSISAYHVYLLAKLTNLLVFAAIVRWALLKTRALRKTMFLLALMPMTLFQAASASYDACLIAGSFLLFAYLTKILLSDESYRICREDVLGICLASIFVIGVKVAYAPLILVLLSIPFSKFGRWKRYLGCIAAVIGIGVAFYVIPTAVNRAIVHECKVVLTDVQIAHANYVRENPIVIPKMMVHTVAYFLPYWMESFFGILGWLDVYFPRPLVVLFWVSLMAVVLSEACSIRDIRCKTKLLSWAGITVFVLGTIYTMYTAWTPVLMGTVGGTLAHGGQGRYFIPIALFVFLLLANSCLLRFRDETRTKINGISEKTMLCTSVLYLILTVALVFTRYWV